MSAINIFPIESQSHPSSLLPYPITNPNILQEKSTPQVKEKRTSFEVKTNSYSQKVEVKTKQEDTIYTKKKTISPPIVTRIITTERPISPHRVSVHQHRRSSSTNSSVQSIRVSVSSSPHGNDLTKTAETQFSFPSLSTTIPNEETSAKGDSYASMISNFVSENLVEPSKSDEEETFDRRPLLDLISELNRRRTLNQSPTIKDQSIERRTVSPTPSDILPPKPLSPFRPVIVHRKYQVKQISFLLFYFKNSYSNLGTNRSF
jgi:hypothetical protein